MWLFLSNLGDSGFLSLATFRCLSPHSDVSLSPCPWKDYTRLRPFGVFLCESVRREKGGYLSHSLFTRLYLSVSLFLSVPKYSCGSVFVFSSSLTLAVSLSRRIRVFPGHRLLTSRIPRGAARPLANGRSAESGLRLDRLGRRFRWFHVINIITIFAVAATAAKLHEDSARASLLAFLQGLFTFYHHGYELAKDFGHFKTPLQISIQNTRDRFEGTRSEVESLMKKMKANPQEHQSISPYTMEGYLFVQKKSPFGSSWVKHYCTYQKEAKKFTMVPFDQKTGGKIGDEETFTLKSCIRRKTDSIEKRFCFDVEGVDRATTITMQALSEEDRRLWIEAMDGREPVYNLNKDNPISEGAAQLDKVGFDLVKKCIRAVEERGLNEQGLYRIAGVNSRVQKLLGLLMGSVDVDLETSTEWEIKTITSTLKHYLRVLPAPLMTFQLQHSFIKAAKLDHPESRLSEIHKYVHRLPEKNRAMLEITIKHLAKVSKNHKQNLMTVANLGVVFGPTLLRPKEETVAAIMDIKFQNIVVEILIENHEQIFQIVPETAPIQPNVTLSSAQRKSFECKPPLCSQRPLMLFPANSNENEKQKNIANSSTESVIIPTVNASSNSKTHRQSVHSLGCCDTEASAVKLERPNSLAVWSSYATLSARFRKRLNSKRKPSVTSPLPPSPSSPLSPSWPMVSAPSSPVPVSSTSSDSSPLSIQCRKARALYACKAEYDSELSFSAGTMFENVHSSKEPGWLEGTLDGKTGLIPENYVEFL
ncbi:rho GTPase-activating protein 26-like [Rhincodon typus]|uniref:rho GTPase-activating protein 26-like n=1 Tax=Rhincodon typus TaxID=259920 RepID=UPI00202DF4A8|nr:rho GTPase-activating protein 26-like [Rhincodon typus]